MGLYINMFKNFSLFIFFLLIYTISFGQEKEELPKKAYITKAATGEAPVIDGLISEAAWESVAWGTDFTERQPNAGDAPSQETAFKILYDDKNLYIAIRAYDDDPDAIVKRMSRRDGFEGDWVEVNIDSYFDHRTAFSFTASASGVKGDEMVSNDGNNWDASWDPIWYLKTSIDDKGWVAEFRIPLSQLRFADKPVHTWGLQFSRRHFRHDAQSVWQYIPPDAPGWVHLFGELHGIEGIKPQKQVEIQPYLVAKTERFEKVEGNPFATGKSADITVGLDGKIGITSDITLDFTINPDFGQVEADPSQVNLSAYQVFFREQRPFFVEGNNILNFPVTNSAAGGNFNSDNLFYSRRIGRRPSYFPTTTTGEFVDFPTNTSIIGAFKLTGKNQNGFSWGILESLTSREKSEIDLEGGRRKETVEPLTNYLVGRFQQDYKEGKTVLGGMVTAVNRKIAEPQLDFLHKQAYSAGVDLTHNFKNRKYFIFVNGIISHVSGDTAAIRQTQTSSVHYFQRPTAGHVAVDPDRESLTGTGGTIKFGKSSGTIVFETGGTWRSPQLELNDAGFLLSSDQINQWSWAQYRKLQPFSIFRGLRLNVNQYLHWDFGGVNTYKAINYNIHTQFKNYWSFGTGATIEGSNVSNADLRGGPAITYPGGFNYWFYLGTDNRKKLRIDLEQSNSHGNHNYSSYREFSLNFSYRPINALNFSISPSVRFNNHDLQYVTTITQAGNLRYIAGKISQETYNVQLRFTYNVNPNLSIEYWGQPFISKGAYNQFKDISSPGAGNYNDRFRTFSGNEISYDPASASYRVDEGDSGTINYQFQNPNFNFVQFQSNLVARWEYIPGSTVFLVWTQSRSGDIAGNPSNQVGNLTGDLFEITPHNIFLIKYTYRFVL